MGNHVNCGRQYKYGALDFALMSKYWVKNISEPIFYGDLVYEFQRTVGNSNFSDQFKKIINRYIKVGHNVDVMRQSARQVLNPIMVSSYGFLFNCTTGVRPKTQ